MQEDIDQYNEKIVTIKQSDIYVLWDPEINLTFEDFQRKWIVFNADKTDIYECLKQILCNRAYANSINIPLIKQAVFTSADGITQMEFEQMLNSSGAILIDYSDKSLNEALMELEAECLETKRLLEEQRRFQNI